MKKILVQKIEKSYGSRKILRNVSITVNSGEITGLLGPNGAGKTTLFYIILGLTKSDKGKIYLNQHDITNLPLHKRSKLGIGYLPQEPSIFRRLSVKDNILAILETQKISKKERLQKLDELLEEFNISHIANSMGISLSGGERRRTEIARTLAANPEFILLDEPLAGIDPLAIKDVKNIVTMIRNKGIGVLITDHNVRDLLSICDHSYIINDGVVLAEGGAREIISNKQVQDIYLGADFVI